MSAFRILVIECDELLEQESQTILDALRQLLDERGESGKRGVSGAKLVKSAPVGAADVVREHLRPEPEKKQPRPSASKVLDTLRPYRENTGRPPDPTSKTSRVLDEVRRNSRIDGPALARELYGDATAESIRKLKALCYQLKHSGKIRQTGVNQYEVVGE